MNNTVCEIKVAPALQVANFLKESGYRIADSNGVPVSNFNRELFGILTPREYSKKTLLGIKFRKKSDFIGLVRFESDFCSVEVYGTQYHKVLHSLFKSFAETTDSLKRVVINLVKDTPETETSFEY